MGHCVRGFEELDGASTALVGGKGAGLAALARMEGVRVPPGVCVTTDAYRRFAVRVPGHGDRLDRLARAGAGDRQEVAGLAAAIRRATEETPVPGDVRADIAAALTALGQDAGYAVRSSATAEDDPATSFAGQHDTHLDVVGEEAVVDRVRRCWASLFTERAVTYRRRNGIDHAAVAMGVVVQRMVPARASGVLFTADPVTGDRAARTVEAVPGPGEALVSGRAKADVWTVRDGRVTARRRARGRGRPVLTDAEALRIAGLGERIAAHLGHPQDVEWCLAGDDLHVVQSRPITTLFPVPEADGAGNRVYVSVGHQQMMTDAMRPLGLSFWQMTTPRPMAEAGGRLFVDLTRDLADPGRRPGLLAALGASDPLVRHALETVVAREGFLPPAAAAAAPGRPPLGAAPAPPDTDPAVVTELIARNRASVAALERDIAPLSGAELVAFIRADVAELRRLLFDPRGLAVISAAMEAARWLDERLAEWLGERDAVDALTRSVPHNVTSEMGLALLDVADVVRRHPPVVVHLAHLAPGDPLDGLAAVPGGEEALAAIRGFLDRFGMRCAGEIDITRPRWSEDPSALVPALLAHVAAQEPGGGARRFAEGLREAGERERVLLERIRALPDGATRARETKEVIDRLRAFTGYREYPKFGMVSRYAVYRRALLGEAERLARAGVLRDPDDIAYLRIEELAEAVRTGRADHDLVRRRREAHRVHAALTPPRVLTSDGEALSGAHRRDVPDGALAGLPASSGTAEGRARVVLDLARADLRPGDILVTRYTDPGWTPLLLAVGGVVTEVGGLMSHGAVIAREYGLPAVVGLDDATRRIPDGARIRVHGGDGVVEILP